ncbi:MAG: T9SS type A sorting domain-containing protein [Schleiferiaceae bacterium]|jgi:hypothetical protein|nr:T9SS type A sorting domain-containing protein [Schleiferiaceae bacterium]
MKKTILFLLALTLSVGQTYAVKMSEIKANRIKFHNFSGNKFDASALKVSIGNTFYDMNSLNIISGAYDVPAGQDLEVATANMPMTGGEVALWWGTVNTSNPSAFDMISYVQYGFAGQLFEALAVSVSLWTGGTHVHGSVPLMRDNDWSSDGADHWTGTILSIYELDLKDVMQIGPNPFNEEVALVNESARGLNYTFEMYDVLGKVALSSQGVREKELIVNTSLLESGVYFIRITNETGEVHTQRVVKK